MPYPYLASLPVSRASRAGNSSGVSEMVSSAMHVRVARSKTHLGRLGLGYLPPRVRVRARVRIRVKVRVTLLYPYNPKTHRWRKAAEYASMKDASPGGS